jgi:hypothetical protein
MILGCCGPWGFPVVGLDWRLVGPVGSHSHLLVRTSSPGMTSPRDAEFARDDGLIHAMSHRWSDVHARTLTLAEAMHSPNCNDFDIHHDAMLGASPVLIPKVKWLCVDQARWPLGRVFWNGEAAHRRCNCRSDFWRLPKFIQRWIETCTFEESAHRNPVTPGEGSCADGSYAGEIQGNGELSESARGASFASRISCIDFRYLGKLRTGEFRPAIRQESWPSTPPFRSAGNSRKQRGLRRIPNAIRQRNLMQGARRNRSIENARPDVTFEFACVQRRTRQ